MPFGEDAPRRNAEKFAYATVESGVLRALPGHDLLFWAYLPGVAPAYAKASANLPPATFFSALQAAQPLILLAVLFFQHAPCAVLVE